MKPKVLAIVPARGGSKGFPGKNKALLQGIPLLAWSIQAGLEATSVDRVLVSTDSEELAQLGKEWGAEVPFLRPLHLSGDTATDVEFLQHALQYYEKTEKWKADFVVLLRPTSPLRPSGIVDICFEKLLANPDAESVRVVTEAPQTPYKMWWAHDSGFLAPILPPPQGIAQPFNAPRQSLPKVYWQIGTLDIIKAAVVVETNSASGDKVLGHYLSSDYAVDIDGENDLKVAERRLAVLKNSIQPKKK